MILVITFALLFDPFLQLLVSRFNCLKIVRFYKNVLCWRIQFFKWIIGTMTKTTTRITDNVKLVTN